MKKEITSLLFISEDQENREFVKIGLEKLFDRVVFAKSPVEASLKIANEKFKVLLIDFKSIKEQHAKFVHNIATNNENMFIVVLSNQEKPKDIIEYQHPHIKFFEPPQTTKDLENMLGPYLYESSLGTNSRKVKKGEVLIRKGNNDKNVYFVIEGSFFVLDEFEGQKVILGTIGKGELVGMMSLLIDGPRSANVIAAEDSTVSEIPGETFMASLNKLPFWAKTLFKTLSNRLIEMNKRISSLTVKKD